MHAMAAGPHLHLEAYARTKSVLHGPMSQAVPWALSIVLPVEAAPQVGPVHAMGMPYVACACGCTIPARPLKAAVFICCHALAVA